MKRVVVALSIFAMSFGLGGCQKIRAVLLQTSALSGATSTISATMISNVNQAMPDDVSLGSLTLGDTLYFFANSGFGPKLYSFTFADGVKQISNSNPGGPDRTWEGPPVEVNGKLYWDGFDRNGRIKFFEYDPAIGAMITEPFVNINPLTGPYLPTQSADAAPTTNWGHDHPYPGMFKPFHVGTTLFFVAHDGDKFEVYQYVQGNPFSVAAISSIGLSGSFARTSAQIIYGVMSNILLFGRYDEMSMLYDGFYYDPALPGQGALPTGSSMNFGFDLSLFLQRSIVVDGLYYFPGDIDGSGNVRLISFDPTSLTFFTALSNTSDTTASDQVADLTYANGALYFSALDAAGARHAYTYALDNTPVTSPIGGLCGTACDNSIRTLGIINSKFIFNGQNIDGGLNFYSTTLGNPTTTQKEFVINPYGQSDEAGPPITVNGKIYFSAHTGYVSHPELPFVPYKSHRRLYEYDPDTGVTTQIYETSNASNDDDPKELTDLNGVLMYTALDSNGHRGLYSYPMFGSARALSGGSGSITNTSGGGDDNVRTLYVANNLLYFLANDNTGATNVYQFDGASVTLMDSNTPATTPPSNPWGRPPIVLRGQGWYAPGTDGYGNVGRVYGNAAEYASILNFNYRNAVRNFFDLFIPRNAYAAPVEYARLYDPNGGGGPVEYFKIDTGGYVRVCSLYGAGSATTSTDADGNEILMLVGAFNPGQDQCGVISADVTDGTTAVNLAKDLGRVQTPYGSFGMNRLYANTVNNWGMFATLGILNRTVNRITLLNHRLGVWTPYSLSAAGTEFSLGVAVKGNYLYTSSEGCGGNNSPSVGGTYVTCRHIYRFNR